VFLYFALYLWRIWAYFFGAVGNERDKKSLGVYRLAVSHFNIFFIRLNRPSNEGRNGEHIAVVAEHGNLFYFNLHRTKGT